MIDIANRIHQLYQGKIFTDVMKNFRTDLFFTFLNIIMETLIPCDMHIVFHESIVKCNYILITLRPKI